MRSFRNLLCAVAALIPLIYSQASHAGQSVPSVGLTEVAFSPGGGAEDLVIKALHTARREIKLMAYSFTSANIVRALLAAKKRGVDVAVVVDYKSNIDDSRSSKSRSALSALAESGIDVRTLDAFAIAHDKVVIVDAETVQTGSFNYSASAEARNSENVLVAWQNPRLAEIYLTHFHRNQRLSKRFVPAY
ncbi:MAG: phospholipase [Burkholderiales bacterium PBB4]|nr:MAG: phospholipase [Burkholderiales bacterium PBB4]